VEAAGTGFLALVATTGRLAQAGTDAATDALGGVPGTFTLVIMPRTAGVSSSSRT